MISRKLNPIHFWFYLPETQILFKHRYIEKGPVIKRTVIIADTFVGEIKGLMPVFITPISCITVQIRKAWTFNVNSRLLISAHPETVFLPDLFVLISKSGEK